MRQRLFPALLFVVLGLLIALTPWILFPVCEKTIQTVSGMQAPMKCFWTGKAASGAGGIIAVAGLFMALAASPAVRQGIALALLPVSLFVFLLPLHIIGVCAAETMPCRMGALPALEMLSTLTALAALFTVLRMRSKGRS